MSKVYDAIMGFAVGDALGVPVEFKQRGTYEEVTDMIGNGTWGQPAGTWSDDSSMIFATMESILSMGGIDTKDIMENFVRWYDDGIFTPYGEAFDVGNTTRTAIERFKSGVPLSICGCRLKSDNGNGALMRILPLSFLPTLTTTDILSVANLTHAHVISDTACTIYLTIAKGLLAGLRKEAAFEVGLDVLSDAPENVKNEFSHIPLLLHFTPDMVHANGYVVDTLEAALWCFMKTKNYRDCVLKAVNLGDDTDTIAAIAGGLAGIEYGVRGEYGVPDEWISKVARKDWIKELCKSFESYVSRIF